MNNSVFNRVWQLKLPGDACGPAAGTIAPELDSDGSLAVILARRSAAGEYIQSAREPLTNPTNPILPAPSRRVRPGDLSALDARYPRKLLENRVFEASSAVRDIYLQPVEQPLRDRINDRPGSQLVCDVPGAHFVSCQD